MKDNKSDAAEIKYEQKSGDYSVAKDNRFDWVVLVICAFIALFIWAYALNVTDPIIEKEVPVRYVYEGLDPELMVEEFETVLVYGPASLFDNLDAIDVVVNRAEFYNKTEIDKRIKYPSRINPVNKEDKTVHITLDTENADAK